MCRLFTVLILSILSLSYLPVTRADSPSHPAKIDVKVPAPVFVKSPSHPDKDCEKALAFLSKVSAEDAPFFRFFSFASSPDNYLETHITLFKYYVNTVSLSGAPVPLYEVPGSNRRLFALDLRRPKWNAEAFSTVARRDKVFTEPNVDNNLAEGLRRIIGIQQDQKTFHVEAIVPAHWFIREVQESDRSNTYYDLLYATERFGKGAGTPGNVGVTEVVQKDIGPEPQEPAKRPWPGGAWTGNDSDKGKFFPQGAFEFQPLAEVEAFKKAHSEWLEKKSQVQELQVRKALPSGSILTNKIKKDFPATIDDWNDKWLIKVIQDALDKEKIFVTKGEVVAGAKNNREKGSYVSYNDRVITFLQTPTGVAMRTFDSLKTTLKKNYANFPKEVSIGDIQFDAGEALVNLPNGLQAALIFNGQGKRVEAGDSRIVRNTVDNFDVTVKTQIGCVTCHGANYGINSPSNEKVKEAIKAGNRLLANDPDVVDNLETFFGDWDDQLDHWRAPYKKILQKLTSSKEVPNGWTGPKLAQESLIFRDWYDNPVTLDQAASELGIPRLAVVLVCLYEGSIDAGNLLLDKTVPRDVWDEDLLPKLALIFNAFRNLEKPEPIFEFFFPELLRQTAEKHHK